MPAHAICQRSPSNSMLELSLGTELRDEQLPPATHETSNSNNSLAVGTNHRTDAERTLGPDDEMNIINTLKEKDEEITRLKNKLNVINTLKERDEEIVQLKNKLSKQEKVLRIRHGDDLLVASSHATEMMEQIANVTAENPEPKAHICQLLSQGSDAAAPVREHDEISSLKQDLADKTQEVMRLNDCMKKLEAYTKETISTFQQECLTKVQAFEAKSQNRISQLENEVLQLRKDKTTLESSIENTLEIFRLLDLKESPECYATLQQKWNMVQSLELQSAIGLVLDRNANAIAAQAGERDKIFKLEKDLAGKNDEVMHLNNEKLRLLRLTRRRSS